MTSTLRQRKHSKDHEQKDEAKIALVPEKPVAKANSDASTVCSNDTAYILTLLKQRHVLFRLDVGPFALVYLLLVLVDHSIGNSVHVAVLLATTLILHLALILATQWSIDMRVRVGYARQTLSIKHSYREYDTSYTHCYVQHQESANGSNSAVVPVYVDTRHNADVIMLVRFQDIVFRYTTADIDQDEAMWNMSKSYTSKSKLQFHRLRYPINKPISFYTKAWKGHESLQQVTLASNIYGPNLTVLKLPTFVELLSEQVVAPFFLFQIFCVVLWSLDEYWYYAIFTLFALLMFESTLAYNRLQSMQRLHQAGQAGRQKIWVRRGLLPVSNTNSSVSDVDRTRLFQWMSIATRELAPGDIVSLSVQSNGQETPVPADILLLAGSAVCDEALLTGESIPQLKQPLDSTDSNDANLDIQDSQYKECILFGGTKLLLANPVDSYEGSMPPEGGVIGLVLRTGFETAQGNLLRTMAHSSHNTSSFHTWDTFIFILMLVACAIVAAGWVLHEGWYDERRNRFRLVLHVIMIITSVVPPELPMELSLAVTNSLSSLMHRCKVYCSELYRIPWAGEVDVCCFDKTGTLTSDEMRLRGVRLFEKDEKSDENDDNVDNKQEESALLHPANDTVPHHVMRIIVGCNSLAVDNRKGKDASGGQIIGDPLEKAVFSQTGYTFRGENGLVPVTDLLSDKPQEMNKSFCVLHRFSFSPKLKRMSVLITEEGSNGKIWALTKGAPEIVKDLIKPSAVPSNYDSIVNHHMRKGRRVLAMAYKDAGTAKNLAKVKDKGRDELERDLELAGLLVLECPLKPDSKSVISELRASNHNVVMITGDALLTAVEVARQVGIVPKKSQVWSIEPKKNMKNDIEYTRGNVVSNKGVYSDEKPVSIDALLQSYSDGDRYCMSGDALLSLATLLSSNNSSQSNGKSMTNNQKSLLMSNNVQEVLKQLVPIVSVFARHSPHHKEAVVAAFNRKGHQTLMCGDGTNDVGALKQAHVGISLISAPEVEAKHRKASEGLSRLRKENKAAKKSGKKRSAKSTESSFIMQLQEAEHELNEVQLGDASVAAPFTSRAMSIRCCKDVIVQGRCTLVTMLQIYKILGINCLVNAMVLSSLFLHGVKQGDRQLTALGIGVAGLFYFVTRATPLPVLSAERPPVTVLCKQALLSIFGQCTVHMLVIGIATYTSLRFVDPYDPSMVPDGPFNPNVLNTCTFLLLCWVTVHTFATNYQGRPFVQDLRENKFLWRSLQLCYGTIIACILEVFPPLNDLLQLSSLPVVSDGGFDKGGSYNWLIGLVEMLGFQMFLIMLVVIDTALSLGIELVLRRVYRGR